MSCLDAALREAVIALARDAAAAIVQVYDRGFEVEHKADCSPITEADLASHRIIDAGLRRLTPQWPVLSEEGASTPWETRRQWRRCWLVDPLDGTREFIKRNAEFTVNIALIEDGVPSFGVVLAPVGGALWHAARGDGAYRRDGDAEAPLSTRRPAVGTLQVAASRSHRDARTQRLLQRIGDAHTVGLGSSLKFCRIAEGGMDVYPRFGPTSEWDTAAAQCVLECAGGAVIAPDGRPFRYNQRDTLLNGDFLALGDPDLPWRQWLEHDAG
ncbi:MAG TPA: 3'(2'),5'-bisphosphate nucleotidase CysQ [Pseudoxanthomonas sp.]|nr:3'(2'),5'-bisphosphate nucleotidase CysQ [Pseudoxanthomonas sp.]